MIEIGLIMDYPPEVGELLEGATGAIVGRVESVEPIPGGEWWVVVVSPTEAHAEALSSLPLTYLGD